MLILAIIAGAGTWFFFQNYQIEGLDKLTIVARDDKGQDDGPDKPDYTTTPQPPQVKRSGQTIRIASFNIEVFGQSKAAKPHVMARLAHIIRQFDVVAIQEIRSKEQGLLPEFIDLINQADRHYDFVIGPRLGRTKSTEQYAYIFDTASLEVDRSQIYSILDPGDHLHREPLVAWFRVRGPDPKQAFTFTLANVHTDPDEVKTEMNVMDDVFRAIQNDTRNEDDVILLGDFNTDEDHIGELASIPGISWAISDLFTNTRGSASYDNLFMQKQATVEFNGRSGVFDFIRHFNLTLKEGEEISDHFPVWAEFSIYEGGVPQPVATLPVDLK
ncbi:MAG: endonuclease/exonuclease/phosphatase [Blastopirellula sp.]|nr:MAG: endonuclease/exonuclease/phosphatase [Blastopirellula sp.]